MRVDGPAASGTVLEIDHDIVELQPGDFRNPRRQHQAKRTTPTLQRAALPRRFLTACKVLGLTRLRTLTIHHGRHTFISHALAGGRTLAEVRGAAGHASLLTTSVYLHVAVDDDGELGNLFVFK